MALVVTLIVALCLHCPTLCAQQIGIASYYAKTVKSKMANGERYHKDSMICAHRTHPFGTLLKVTHLKNQKSVVVRVTDRGPFGRGRIVDLSYGAAEKLDMIRAGLAKVKVEVYVEHGTLEPDLRSDTTGLILDLKRPEYEFPYVPSRNDSTRTEEETEE